MKFNYPQKILVILFIGFFIFASTLIVNAEEDRFVVGQMAEVSGLHTLIEVDVYAFERINLINEPLTYIDHDLNIIPWLATDWQLSDNAMRIEMDLREEVYWQHGREFVAEDVKYTYEWLLNEENPAANRDLYQSIENIEIIDDHEIVFHLNEPYAFLINNMARVGIIPYDYHEDVGYEEFGQEPIGTGPYMHDEWRSADFHILTAFEDYWGGTPNFNEIEFRPIPEDSSRLLAFEAGELDASRGVVSDELARLEEDPGVIVSRAPAAGYNYVGINQDSDLNPDVTQNEYFREALAYLVDREAIVDEVQGGQGYPGKSQIVTSMPHFNDEIDYPEYNFERAQDLINESGLEEGAEVKIFTFEDPGMSLNTEIIEYELSQVGIDAEVTIEEFGAFLDRIYDTNDYDLFLLGWTGQIDPDRASYRQFHSEGSANHVGFSNERMDELLEKGRMVDPTSEESIEIYKEVQEIIINENAKVFINYQESIDLIQPEFEGFATHPYGANTWIQLVNDVVRVE